MTIVKFMALALLCVFVLTIIKSISKDFTVFASIACSCVLLFFVFSSLSSVYADIQELFLQAKIPLELLKPCIKIIGLAYLTEFTASIAEDAGEKGVGDKVRLFGKIAIFASTLPLVSKFINMVVGLL